MDDKFHSMTELIAEISAEGNYIFDIYDKHNSRIKLFAPHAGCIEPGTRRIVKDLAGERWDYFMFIGKRKDDCTETLHVTSENYDEPRCVQMAKSATLALAIHGCDRTDSCIEVGGASPFVNEFSEYLSANGYCAVTPPPSRSGTSPCNFVNFAGKGGIQLELSVGFRQELYEDYSHCRKPRQEVFNKFINDLGSWLVDVERKLENERPA